MEVHRSLNFPRKKTLAEMILNTRCHNGDNSSISFVELAFSLWNRFFVLIGVMIRVMIEKLTFGQWRKLVNDEFFFILIIKSLIIIILSSKCAHKVKKI